MKGVRLGVALLEKHGWPIALLLRRGRQPSDDCAEGNRHAVTCGL